MASYRHIFFLVTLAHRLRQEQNNPARRAP